MKKLYAWLMRNKWRKWGTVALLCLAINYTLLVLGMIEAAEFEVITSAILTLVKFFTIGI
ncbi:hypothetical protein [Pontibacter rugosus]|uniref:Uncharacterized protein n=1 Tax=Pontibacter rugosus TaxID=1745966 RepID=A0ABW3SJC0_9BACT